METHIRKLLELGRFDLALDLATKLGLDVTAVWKTWAMQCVKNGRLEEAREKFRQSINQATRRSSVAIKDKDIKNQAQSKLLNEIVANLLHCAQEDGTKQQHESKQTPASTHASNNITNNHHKNDLGFDSGNPTVFNEIMYYLNTYGTLEDTLRFLVKTNLWGKAIELLINNKEYSALYSKLFVHDIFMVAATGGSLEMLFKQMSAVDPTKQKVWKYLIAVCRYCSRARNYELLYHVQVYMNDHLRAAITQINYFFLKRPVTSYKELNKRVEHLELARQHCQHYLSDKIPSNNVDSGVSSISSDTSESSQKQMITANRLTMTMSDKDVERKLKMINSQIDVTKSFARNNVQGYVNDLKVDNSDFDAREENADPNTPCTLFDKNHNRKIIFAALVACYYGSSAGEAFKQCERVISENELDRLQVYSTAGQILILQEGSQRVERVSRLIGWIKSDMMGIQNTSSSIQANSIGRTSRSTTSPKSSSPQTSGTPGSNRKNEKYIAHMKRETEEFCDRIIGVCIRCCKDPDHQLALVKLLSSDELKIDFFIELGKLSNARLLACKLNRVNDARRVVEAATRLKQDHVKTVCQMWLAQKADQSNSDGYR